MQKYCSEVSFEWSRHRISSTDSKVRTTLHVSIIGSESERVKKKKIKRLHEPKTVVEHAVTRFNGPCVGTFSVHF